MICSRCGFEHKEVVRVCSGCKEPMDIPPKLTLQLIKLLEIVENLQKGQITSSEFNEYMINKEVFLKRIMAEVKAIEIPDDMKEELKPEMEIGMLGIEMYIRSVELFIEYVSRPGVEILEEGKKTAKKANELLNSALMLNWKSYNSLKDTTIEVLKNSGADINI